MHLDEGTIHAWLDGALDAEEAARVEQHAAECAACANAVAEARGLVAGASRILSALDGGLGTGDGAGRGTGLGGRGRGRAARGAWHVTRGAWRVAAAILIVAAGTTIVMRNQPNGSPSRMRQVSSDTALAKVFAAPNSPVSASPVPPVMANADSVGRGTRVGEPVLGRRIGGVVSPSRGEPQIAMGAESPAPRPAAGVPRPDKKMALADAMMDSTRRPRRDSAAVDSTSRRTSLEAVAVTSLPSSASRPMRAAGVAGNAAPSAVARLEMRVAAPAAVNYVGCYTVVGEGGLPSVLSLDNTQSGARQKVAALTAQRVARFGISSVEANQRKSANGWWEPLEGGRRGVRISVDDRAPIVFTAFGDSLVSSPDSVTRTPAVTLHRMNCPNR